MSDSGHERLQCNPHWMLCGRDNQLRVIKAAFKQHIERPGKIWYLKRAPTVVHIPYIYDVKVKQLRLTDRTQNTENLRMVWMLGSMRSR